MRFFSLVILSFFLSLPTLAQNGHKINIKIQNYQEDILYLAYHYGNKQYIEDTVYRNTDDSFVIEGDEPLEPGLYMLIFAPDNASTDLIVDDNQQYFDLSLDKNSITDSFETSDTRNQAFYGYIRFLNKMRSKGEAIQNASESEHDANAKANLMSQLSAEVAEYQENLIKEHDGSLLSALLKAGVPIAYPDFEGTADERNAQALIYAQKHYLDNTDLTDDRLVRTPFLHTNVEYYIEKLQVQSPNTLNTAIDQILSQMETGSKAYQYFVIHFLNKYAKSKTIGMDAVYVHVAETYYTNGNAPWVETAQLDKILNNAASLKPLLLGKTAPNLLLQNSHGERFNLHDTEAAYTVLYFWRYDCQSCKDNTPAMKSFFEEFKTKDVKIVAVCTKGQDDIKGCWNYAQEEGIDNWVHAASIPGENVVDGPYNVNSTPLIYLLDQEKKIIIKRVNVEQLTEILKEQLSN